MNLRHPAVVICLRTKVMQPLLTRYPAHKHLGLRSTPLEKEVPTVSTKRPVYKYEIHEPTDEEEAAIQRRIAADPDTWEAPKDAKIIPRRKPGRPRGKTKTQVSIKIDHDVLAALKSPDPKGWQTRLNALLRRGLNL